MRKIYIKYIIFKTLIIADGPVQKPNSDPARGLLVAHYFVESRIPNILTPAGFNTTDLSVSFVIGMLYYVLPRRRWPLSGKFRRWSRWPFNLCHSSSCMVGAACGVWPETSPPNVPKVGCLNNTFSLLLKFSGLPRPKVPRFLHHRRCLRNVHTPCPLSALSWVYHYVFWTLTNLREIFFIICSLYVINNNEFKRNIFYNL